MMKQNISKKLIMSNKPVPNGTDVAMLCASGTLKDDYAKKQQLSKEALYAAYYAAGMNPAIPTAGNSGKMKRIIET
ncbi:MAG: hypothetical protein LBU51_11225 [Bacteroidales bacterium]|jgi:hypothetical protein|nr:hypothetical protein [Bacteroidales bacterium]